MQLFGVPMSLAHASYVSYVSYAQTAAGTPRYRCNEYLETFTGKQKPLAGRRTQRRIGTRSCC